MNKLEFFKFKWVREKDENILETLKIGACNERIMLWNEILKLGYLRWKKKLCLPLGVWNSLQQKNTLGYKNFFARPILYLLQEISFRKFSRETPALSFTFLWVPLMMQPKLVFKRKEYTSFIIRLTTKKQCPVQSRPCLCLPDWIGRWRRKRWWRRRWRRHWILRLVHSLLKFIHCTGSKCTEESRNKQLHIFYASKRKNITSL